MHFRFALLIIVSLSVTACHHAEPRVLFVELEDATGIKKGTEMHCRGVIAGRVQEVSWANGHKLPVARVVLEDNALLPAKGDKFQIAAEALLSDPVIDMIPGISQNPLPDGATVHAELLPRQNIVDVLRGQVTKMASEVDFVKDLLDLPEPKRNEVLIKIRQLIDDAKKESAADQSKQQ